MREPGVCGIIVTFHPRAGDFDNYRMLHAQIERLIIIDNGSPEPALERLRRESDELGFILIENGDNLGIGAALNIGVRKAMTLGVQWIALFDQDSCVTEKFMRLMLEDFRNASALRNVQLIVPRYQDPNTGVQRVCGLDRDGGPFVTITSGSVLPIEIFDRIGGFNEELFIYTVDDEFSLRLRSLGFSIAESSRAILLHASGVPTYKIFLGRRFSTTNYRAAVRYYISRNRVWMLRNYGLRYPRWARGALRASAIDLVKLLLSETDRISKIIMIGRGILDGICNRMGKTVTI